MFKKLHLVITVTTVLLRSIIPSAQPVDNALVEQMPYFMGCEDLENGTAEKRQCSNTNLIEFISSNIQYPDAAREQGIEGTVLLTFLVNAEGRIEKAEVLRDIGGDCGKEALRIVALMPKWEPALQDGKAMAISLNLPVTFSLQNANQQVIGKYQIQWGNLSGKRISKEELKNLVAKKLIIRDELGKEISINNLTFIFQRKRTVLQETSTGKITNKMERLIKKIKKGGTFIIIASIQKNGEVYDIEREFEVVE
jgi:TonB family protein